MWEERATLGTKAGTDDLNLKTLEIELLKGLFVDQENILDAGCGNGVTALSIAEQDEQKRIIGFDYSPNMISEATRNAEERDLNRRARFICQDLLKYDHSLQGRFDGIYTERSLINLDSLDDQKRALYSLAQYAKPGARLVLCESFIDGLEEINLFRHRAGIEEIQKPWHNRYLALSELGKLLPECLVLVDCLDFSATYYFVSRVINAWQAKHQSENPDYDAPLNHLSLRLPTIDKCAQTKAIILSKRH